MWFKLIRLNTLKRGSDEGTEITVREAKTIMKKGWRKTSFEHEEGKEIVIFFPRISVSALNDVKLVTHQPSKSHTYPYISSTNHVWVQGKGNDGKNYYARIFSEDMYKKLLIEEKEQELRQHEQHIENMVKAGRYEEAARAYEQLGKFEKAGEVRKMAKTEYVVNFNIGKDGAIQISCPHCGANYPLESKSNEIVCSYCKKTYVVPRRVLDML